MLEISGLLRAIEPALNANYPPAAFAQETAEEWRAVADQIRPKVPKLAVIMDDAESDVLAHMTFLGEHRVQLHCTNPIERVNREGAPKEHKSEAQRSASSFTQKVDFRHASSGRNM